MKEMNAQQSATSGAENSGAENNTNGTNNPNTEGNGGTDGAAAGSKQTYTQEDLDKIVIERTGRAEKSALKSFFQQQGLTEEEANAAMLNDPPKIVHHSTALACFVLFCVDLSKSACFAATSMNFFVNFIEMALYQGIFDIFSKMWIGRRCPDDGL